MRELTGGAETVVTELEDGPVGGTPPEWPVSWSPDDERIAHVTDEGAVVTQVGSRKTNPVDESGVDRPLAPGWLADGRLLTMYGCCTVGGNMRSAGPDGVEFAVRGPVRSVRAGRDGVGAWLTIEEQGLHHWDGTRLRKVTSDALLTSG